MCAQIARLMAISMVLLWSARVLAEGPSQPEAGPKSAKEGTWRDQIARLEDPDPTTREIAAYALSCCSDPEAVPALLQAFKHKTPLVRSNAIHRFKTYPDPRAVLPLIECLKDSNPSIRSDAIDALGNSEDPLAIPPLVAIMQDVK